MDGHAAENKTLEWCGRDIAQWLNHIAGYVRDGDTLSPGRVVHVDDPHLALQLAFTIGEPVDKYEVEALRVVRTAIVLPVRWSAIRFADPPRWPRTPNGVLRCPCEPLECQDCARENRAARRAAAAGDRSAAGR